MQISRRVFLRNAGLGAGAVAVAGACEGDTSYVERSDDVGASEFEPTAPARPLLCGIYRFFDAAEYAAVEAIAARIVPGDAGDPGAREACVAGYIDAKLAEFADFAEPTYFRGPFARSFEGDPPEAPPDSILVPVDQMERYGFQVQRTPQTAYRMGLAALAEASTAAHGAPFAALAEDVQDEILTALSTSGDDAGSGGASEGAAGGSGGGAPLDLVGRFGELDPQAFFTMVRQDVIEGMWADPVYGGNRDLVGWELIGYPGAQRSYSPTELKLGTAKRPQSLHDLPVLHPGRPSGSGRVPVQTLPEHVHE